jgi:hypothetical protein
MEIKYGALPVEIAAHESIATQVRGQPGSWRVHPNWSWMWGRLELMAMGIIFLVTVELKACTACWMTSTQKI